MNVRAWEVIGVPRGILGGPWGSLEESLGVPGVSFGVPKEVLGDPWGSLGKALEVLGGPWGFPRDTKNGGCSRGAPWDGPGRLLVQSCLQKY